MDRKCRSGAVRCSVARTRTSARWHAAGWHLELVHDPAAPLEPRPTPEDLLVIYLGEPVPDSLVEQLERHGGKRVPAHNSYGDTWGVTLQDPDGYLLVLSTRAWSNS